METWIIPESLSLALRQARETTSGGESLRRKKKKKRKPTAEGLLCISFDLKLKHEEKKEREMIPKYPESLERLCRRIIREAFGRSASPPPATVTVPADQVVHQREKVKGERKKGEKAGCS